MKCYMGHFGEANSTSPEDIMAKISDVELLISNNNMAINELNQELDKLQKQISALENNELRTVNNLTEQILQLVKTAKEREESLRIMIPPNFSMSW
jgi:hypothetical protein